MARIAIVSRETFREHAASRRRERRAARIDSARYVGCSVRGRVTDPAGHAVSHGHDQRGHVLSETHPDSGTVTSSDTSLGEIASRLTAYDPGVPARPTGIDGSAA